MIDDAMADKYRNYKELSTSEIEGVDYEILFKQRQSSYAIMAPHGGYIEHATQQISHAISGEEHSWYCFSGLQDHCHRLHITSNRFDEPHALKLAKNVETVITVHGAYGKGLNIYVGGLNEPLKNDLIDALNHQDFTAGLDPNPSRQGKAISNICNRGQLKQGVQIELTQAFRKSLFDNADYDTPVWDWRPNQHFDLFVNTVRSILK